MNLISDQAKYEAQEMEAVTTEDLMVQRVATSDGQKMINDGLARDPGFEMTLASALHAAAGDGTSAEVKQTLAAFGKSQGLTTVEDARVQLNKLTISIGLAAMEGMMEVHGDLGGTAMNEMIAHGTPRVKASLLHQMAIGNYKKAFQEVLDRHKDNHWN